MGEVFSAALVGGLIGTFFGGFTKFLWERWLPEWLTWRRTQRVERERQLASVRAPAILAFSDLHGRLDAIASRQAQNYRYVKSIGQGDYYIHSTAYLVARAFAWQEILRRRMASYDYAELYARLELLTEAFSHGGRGFQVFRLEQTEIGERLITVFDDDNAACMSLSGFLDQMEQDDPPRWLSELRRRVTELLDHPVKELCRTARVTARSWRCWCSWTRSGAGGRRSPRRRSTSARLWSACARKTASRPSARRSCSRRQPPRGSRRGRRSQPLRIATEPADKATLDPGLRLPARPESLPPDTHGPDGPDHPPTARHPAARLRPCHRAAFGCLRAPNGPHSLAGGQGLGHSVGHSATRYGV